MTHATHAIHVIHASHAHTAILLFQLFCSKPTSHACELPLLFLVHVVTEVHQTFQIGTVLPGLACEVKNKHLTHIHSTLVMRDHTPYKICIHITCKIDCHAL